MFIEIRLKSKGFIASLAVKVLESRMGLHVSTEVGPVCKGFSAVSTAVWFVSRVRSHVTL